eukprot:EST45885.1 Hypothetical protein SS50377_14176 [Spironucleus salmonicida]
MAEINNEIVEELYQEAIYLNQYLQDVDCYSKQLSIQQVIKEFRKLKSIQDAIKLPQEISDKFKEQGWLIFDVNNKKALYEDVKEQNRMLMIHLEKLKNSYIHLFQDNGFYFRYIMFMKYQIYYPKQFVYYTKEEQTPDKIIKIINKQLLFLKFQ